MDRYDYRPADARAAGRLSDGSPRFRDRKSRLLIIDDDAMTTATFAQMLRLEGHEVRTSQSAKSALRDAPSIAPDAIIVDLHMPVMDGLAFVQQLRAQEPDLRIPVAMVTGDYAMAPAVTKALENLGVTICFKPLWLEDIANLASSLLSDQAH